jgi:hypothetical protein
MFNGLDLHGVAMDHNVQRECRIVSQKDQRGEGLGEAGQQRLQHGKSSLSFGFSAPRLSEAGDLSPAKEALIESRRVLNGMVLI